MGRLLVFNCHEAWVYQLSALDYDLDVVIGLKGRYTQGWDLHIRPVPSRARLITLAQASAAPDPYMCIITHNPTDLLDIKARPEPRILMLHLPIEARIVEERCRTNARQVRQTLHDYVHLMGVHVVAVSDFKGRSWGFAEDVIPFGIEPGDYPAPTSELAMGLRVSNFIESRRQFLLWDFHQRAFEDIPVRIVGHNPGMPGVAASQDWADMKRLFSLHRFYIHTADPQLEDGYNMATIEAMAAGLPVLGNRHPSSPVEHGVSGFLSDDPLELRRYARLLLEDRDLAMRMGENARRRAVEQFSMARFRQLFHRSIEIAVAKRQQVRRSPKLPILDIPAGIRHTPKVVRA